MDKQLVSSEGRWVVLPVVLFALLTASSGPEKEIVSFLEAAGFSGAVLVVHGQETEVMQGFGLADYELGVENRADHIFKIGSLTKPLTATAVLVAEEQGLLNLGDPVCEYLRVCPPEWGEVRIEHLLEHTSGIPDLFGRLERAPLLEITQEINRFLRDLGSVPLRDLPGRSYRYSNFNYMLLGYVLATASESDWETYLVESVLEPVGLGDTRYDDVWKIVEGRVHGYKVQDAEPGHVLYNDHSAYAAGGLRSTLSDLRRWHRALVAGEIVDSAHLARMFRPNEGAYGLGWQVIRALGREMHNHTGGVSGFSSHLAWYPSDDLLVVLLSNFEDQPVKALACDVARLVLDTPVQPRATSEWFSQGAGERCDQELIE